MIPNDLLDGMAEMTPAEFKATMAIYRQIVGYSQYRKLGRRRISLAQLERLTGLSRQGVSNVMKTIEGHGYVSKVHGLNGNTNEWVVNSLDYLCDKVVNSVDQGSQLSGLGVVNSVDQGSQLSGLHIKKGTKEKEEENLEETPPTPPMGGTESDSDSELDSKRNAYWMITQRLVKEWQELTGDYRRLNPDRKFDLSEFYAPAMRILVEHEGDYAAAWQAVQDERERMIRAGLGNVRKLSAIASGVISALERAKLPAAEPVSQPAPVPNGMAALQNYAARRKDFFQRNPA